MQVIGDTKRPIKIWASDLEPEAEQQVRNLGNMPFIHSHVAVMPDAHAGRGSTIGTVIATRGAIIPSAVGVDIGCGMSAVKLPFNISDMGESMDKLRSSIERSVPVGFNKHKELRHFDDGIHQKTSDFSREFVSLSGEVRGYIDVNNCMLQLGTLGGGNHFIEVCQDTAGGAWVMLHSGSRNLGKRIADFHIGNAKDLMKKYFIDLPDPELAYLAQGTPQFTNYINDLHIAQRYAQINRDVMMTAVLKDIAYHVYGEPRDEGYMTVLRVDCHHNYTAMENHFGQNIWVTRKGAVSAREGQLGIIPGSMGAKSFIVEGLGNPNSFCSCSHGAGRKMSRTKAKALFTVDDLKAQTAGVECRKDADVVDEIPGAYKDIDLVMSNQADLVKPIYQLKQLLCVKG